MIGAGVRIANNLTTTGIGYFGTIIGNNLSRASRSVVTVDGVGRLGKGTFIQGNNFWLPNGANKIYTNSFVGIGGINPTERLEVAGNINLTSAYIGYILIKNINSIL